MRVKRGTTKKRKHKKILKQAKGYRMTYSKLYRRAREALLHAGEYSIAHRRKRAGQFKRLWIQRINAALTEHDISYSKFIGRLKKNEVELDRKVLAGLALDYPDTFKAIVDKVK